MPEVDEQAQGASARPPFFKLHNHASTSLQQPGSGEALERRPGGRALGLMLSGPFAPSTLVPRPKPAELQARRQALGQRVECGRALPDHFPGLSIHASTLGTRLCRWTLVLIAARPWFSALARVVPLTPISCVDSLVHRNSMRPTIASAEQGPVAVAAPRCPCPCSSSRARFVASRSLFAPSPGSQCASNVALVRALASPNLLIATQQGIAQTGGLSCKRKSSPSRSQSGFAASAAHSVSRLIIASRYCPNCPSLSLAPCWGSETRSMLEAIEIKV